MRDQWRYASLLPSLQRAGCLHRRALLRTAGAVGVAGSFGGAARRPGAFAQDAGGEVIKSRTRAAVMVEILDAYPDLRPEGVPKGGSVIIANLGDLESFNPFVATNNGTLELLSLIYEGLVGVHPVDGSIVPGLAEYEVAADGVTYTFRIHPDARFHDGTPVTAADAEFTLDMFVDPDSLTYSSSALEVLNGYRAVDDNTFEMVSNGRIASFLYDVPTTVMPKHVWEGIPASEWAADPGSTGEDATRVVGSGPYTFEAWVQGDHATLARNEHYWNRDLGRVPLLDTLVFQIVSDSEARTLALEAGDVDVARLASPADIDRFANADEVEVVTSDTLGFTCYAYQLDQDRTSLFQDEAVRQALFIALDRQAIVDSFLAGKVEVARSTQPPLSPAYRPDGRYAYEYDPDRARVLLERAGWTDADGDGVRQKDGQRFRFAMLVRGDHALRTSLAAYMQDAWADIGVEMEVQPLAPAILGDRFDAGEFEMVLLGLGWTADPGQGWMFATGGNSFGYSNPEHDRLEIEQRSTLDAAQRVDLIAQQAKIVWEDLPIGILFFDIQIVGHNEQLKNFFPNGFGGLVWGAPFWYLEP